VENLQVETNINPYEGLKNVIESCLRWIDQVETNINPYEGLKKVNPLVEIIDMFKLKPT